MIDGRHGLEQLGHPRLLVFGDVMLDRYTWGDAERVSPEAPVLVLQSDNEEIRPGGAASVAGLLRALEADVVLAGVTGDDADGRVLRRLLDDEGIDPSLLLADADRPTTCKQRFVGRAAGRHAHQILRVDHETRVPVSAEQERQLAQRLIPALESVQALLISDYGKGVCTPQLVRRMIAAARERSVPAVIDPCRTSDYGPYAGASLITPNRAEAGLATGRVIDTPEQAIEAATLLCRQLGIETTVVTLDRDGMVAGFAADTADGTGPVNGTDSPNESAAAVVGGTQARAVYDITGAGDTVVAVLGMAVAGGMELRDAMRIANRAAGLQVERVGVSPVTRQQLAAELARTSGSSAGKVTPLDELRTQVADYRRAGRVVVLTNGCFDLLHVGHVTSLEHAAASGDVLIVAVNADTTTRHLKGDGRPVIPATDRARLLAALACVDHVLVFDEPTPNRILNELRPDVLAKGGTYAPDEVVGREVVESYGGRVVVTGAVDGVSTTEILSGLSAERNETTPH